MNCVRACLESVRGVSENIWACVYAENVVDPWLWHSVSILFKFIQNIQEVVFCSGINSGPDRRVIRQISSFLFTSRLLTLFS